MSKNALTAANKTKRKRILMCLSPLQTSPFDPEDIICFQKKKKKKIILSCKVGSILHPTHSKWSERKQNMQHVGNPKRLLQD